MNSLCITLWKSCGKAPPGLWNSVEIEARAAPPSRANSSRRLHSLLFVLHHAGGGAVQEKLVLNEQFSSIFTTKLCTFCGCAEDSCICDEPDAARGEGDI